jgi:predicted nucleic acid-binding protein
MKQAMAVRPVVVDAMVLRDDLRRAIRFRKATALLDAADSGLRLYCADHVAKELERHLPEWIGDLIDPAEGRRLFERHYLRKLRVVTVPPGPLHPDEASRIDKLRATGSRDVPTAILALMLNAPVLTRDKALLRAVYGDAADVDALAEWLGIALAGRVMGESDVQSWAMAATGELTLRAGFATGEALIRLFARLPLHIQLLILGVVVGGLVLARKPLLTAARSTREAGLKMLSENVLPVIATMVTEREFAAEMLLAASPSRGDGWIAGLATLPEAPKGEALLRVCLYALARSSPRTASALAGELPSDLEIASREAKVRAVLRGHRCFHPLGRGRFQVGRPRATRPTAGPGTAKG